MSADAPKPKLYTLNLDSKHLSLNSRTSTLILDPKISILTPEAKVQPLGNGMLRTFHCAHAVGARAVAWMSHPSVGGSQD